MQNSKSIAVLMSTYNGERYLSVQIDSILQQSCQDFTLYIRDDGSTDSTLDVIRYYCDHYQNIVLIPSNKNLGVTKSFLKLLELVESNYYMFCDQDDVWKKEKIALSYERIKKEEQLETSQPLLLYTDLTAVNAELDVIKDSMWEFRGHEEKLPHTFDYLCHYHDIDGCTTMFNNAAKNTLQTECLSDIPPFMYHDWLLALFVSKKGGIIIPLAEKTMLFRRHGSNETNVTAVTTSILQQPNLLFSYIRKQWLRYLFFRKMGYGNFLIFIWNKYKIVKMRKLLELS